MNYLQQETKHALAAEFVLGTLHGSARARFRQLMVEHSELADTVNQWESYFNDMALHLNPIVPDDSVWEKIQARLDNAKIKSADDNVVSLPQKTNNFWKGLSVLATAAVVILAVLLVKPIQQPVEDSIQFTVVTDEQNTPLWLIEIFTQKIEAQATKNVLAKANNDYELWMVPKDGSAPISLGLLAQTGKTSLPKNAIFEQIDIAALAVSLEPVGGSPNGSPTEVLYIAELAIL
ncbi:anti-sigma factor [Aliiglaciecola lipolytica]|uniref:Anti-sigma K factor RskA C-terminal domain-containing protein n=1 Tax=Aliiglaciecola lipolytica E3 TaxID=1127673 RepID=K6YHA5_9ALTE|nr:anti-sigma factor [Aliiglaciecola lipolytica]GAC16003.1 hypothetical protein GLIP_3389 [Aliiglaciecola lipolytica E3]